MNEVASIKLDLHVHSVYSGDSIIRPDELIKMTLKKNLNGFTITDHSTLKAFRILKKMATDKDIIIIPAMEIETNIGEVIGLFIEEEIDLKKNDFFTIIDKIKDNNGLIVIPHPFDFLRPNHLKMKLLTDKIIKKYIDGIEIINSRIIFQSCIKKARKYNQTHRLFESGGSDAHTPNEIGNGYTLIKNTGDLTSLDEIYDALKSRNSISCGHRSSPLVHVKTIFNKIQKGLYF